MQGYKYHRNLIPLMINFTITKNRIIEMIENNILNITDSQGIKFSI